MVAAAQAVGLEVDALIALTVGLLAAPLAAVITWALARPKQKADVHSSMVSSASTAVDAITGVLGEVRRELEEARQEIAALRAENADLHQMVIDLRKEVTELHNLKVGNGWT